MCFAKISEPVTVACLPHRRDVVGRDLPGWCETEPISSSWAQDHRKQFQQGALAGTALANECELSSSGNIQPWNGQPEFGATRLVALGDTAQRKYCLLQGSASSSSG